MAKFDDLTSTSPAWRNYFKDVQNQVLDAVYKDVRWKETSSNVADHPLRSLVRTSICQRMVSIGNEDAKVKALKLFKSLQGGATDVSVDVLTAVYDILSHEMKAYQSRYRAGVKYGQVNDYEYVLGLYKKSTIATEQQRFLRALASSEDQSIQQRTLELAISGQVRKQDALFLVRYVVQLGGLNAPSFVWSFLRNNWNQLVDFWKGGDWSKVNDLVCLPSPRYQ